MGFSRGYTLKDAAKWLWTNRDKVPRFRMELFTDPTIYPGAPFLEGKEVVDLIFALESNKLITRAPEKGWFLIQPHHGDWNAFLQVPQAHNWKPTATKSNNKLHEAVSWLLDRGQRTSKRFSRKNFLFTEIEPGAPLLCEPEADALITEMAKRNLLTPDAEVGYFHLVETDPYGKFDEFLAELNHGSYAKDLVDKISTSKGPVQAGGNVAQFASSGTVGFPGMISPTGTRRFEHQNEPAKSPTPEKEEDPPKIIEFKKWCHYHLENNKQLLLKAKIAVAIIFLCGFAVAWLAGLPIYVTTKNDTIQNQEKSISFYKDRLDVTQKDNERLIRENLDYKNGINEKATPLKRRTLVLSSQLTTFALTADSNPNRWNEWEHRFWQRLDTTLKELDAEGLNTPFLMTINTLNTPTSNELAIISKDLEKLANKLKE